MRIGHAGAQRTGILPLGALSMRCQPDEGGCGFSVGRSPAIPPNTERGTADKGPPSLQKPI